MNHLFLVIYFHISCLKIQLYQAFVQGGERRAFLVRSIAAISDQIFDFFKDNGGLRCIHMLQIWFVFIG